MLGGVGKGGAKVAVGAPLTLTTDQKVAQSELRASFALPSATVRLGVSILGGTRPASTTAAAAAAGAKFSTEIFIDFVPRSGRTAGDSSSRPWSVNAGYDQSSILCPNYSGKRFDPPPSLSNRSACPSRSEPLLLKPSDTSLEFAVWCDNVVCEVFLMGGRQAWTIPLPCEAIVGGAGAAAFARSVGGGTTGPGQSGRDSGRGVTLLSAQVWEVKGIEYDEDTESPDNRT